MSIMAMYKVPEKGGVEEVKSFGNSAIFALLVWGELCERYLGSRDWFTHCESGALWKLAKDPRVAEADQIVLAATFDKVMVRKENFPRLLAALTEWKDVNNGYSHIGGIIECLEELQQDDGCHAVCWWITSTSDNPWEYYVSDEDADDYDEVRSYDISKGDKHWYLFDEYCKAA